MLPCNDVRIQNNFNGFSLIDVHQNATLSDPFESKRSRVIGNRCTKHCEHKILGTFITLAPLMTCPMVFVLESHKSSCGK